MIPSFESCQNLTEPPCHKNASPLSSFSPAKKRSVTGHTDWWQRSKISLEEREREREKREKAPERRERKRQREEKREKTDASNEVARAVAFHVFDCAVVAVVHLHAREEEERRSLW